MLLTPKEEMAGELRHATGAQTSLTVDVRNGRSIVRTDQHMLQGSLLFVTYTIIQGIISSEM